MDRSTRIVAGEVLEELDSACEKFPPMVSAHEGYAILLEEMDELWAEVRAHDHNRTAMREEAIQVAAMAIRFVVDVCDAPGTTKEEE